MPLRDVESPAVDFTLPPELLAFLREADQRINEFVKNPMVQVRGFVPSCFETVSRSLLAIDQLGLAPGKAFCEWGSGFGVVASVAGMLGYDACGIEIDYDLIAASIELAEDFEVPVEFVHGSFIPAGAEDMIERESVDADDQFMLDTSTDRAYEELGLDICDFDVIFAFPWPNDEQLMARLFEAHAGHGALLLTYSGLDNVRIRRKISAGR